MKKFDLTTSIVSSFILVSCSIYSASMYQIPNSNSLEFYSIFGYFFTLFAVAFYFAFHLFSIKEMSDPKHYIVGLGLTFVFLFTFFFGLLLLPTLFMELHFARLSQVWITYFVAGLLTYYTIFCVSKIIQHAVK